MKKLIAIALMSTVATSAYALPLAAPSMDPGAPVITIAAQKGSGGGGGGAEAQAIQQKYKAQIEALRAQMKAELEALKAKKQAQMQQGGAGMKKKQGS